MKPKTLIAILCILYTVGIVGILLPDTRAFILQLTLINLAITLILMLAMHKKWSIASIVGMALVAALGFFIEVAGIKTQSIFGAYNYGATLGPKYWGVPYAMGINWLILIYASRILANNASSNPLIISLLSAVIMVGLDWIMEPVALFMGMWTWEDGIIPIQNYIAWFVFAFFFQLLYVNIEKKMTNSIAVPVLIIQFVFFGLLRAYLEFA